MILTDKQIITLKEFVKGEMDYLEDVINERLNTSIKEALGNISEEERMEAIVIAREVFFKG